MKASHPFSPFDIPMQALANGEHRFEYELNGVFFGLFEASLIGEARIKVDLLVQRQGGSLDCTVRSQGAFSINCDRCLESLDWPVDDQSTLVVQVTQTETQASNDEILYLAATETHLNLAHFFYENIHLQVPLRAVCEEASLTCKSPEQLSQAETIAFSTQNSDGTTVDPRWEQLKNLNFN